MCKFYISKFVHKIHSFSDSYFLYDTRNLNLYAISENELDLYDKILKDGVSENDINPFVMDLKKNNLLTEINDDITLEKIRNNNQLNDRYNNRFDINYARIKLTNMCNLACKYCFVEKGVECLSELALKKILDTLICQNRGNILWIQYFGGEPMLKMELIKYAHNYLFNAYREKKVKGFREEIVTNGFFLTEESIRYLYESNITVTISVDGPKEINDLKRVTLSGEGTFDVIKENLKLYKKITGKASILITLQEHNIHNFIDNTKRLICELGITSVGINMPQPCQKGWEITGKEMFNSIIGIYDFCLEKGIEFIHGGNNILYALQFKKRNIGSCSNCIKVDGGYRCGVSIDYNFEVSTCIVDKKRSSTFELSDFGERTSDRVKEWFITNNYKEKCFECVAYNICTGMCNMEKEYSDVNAERCYFYKNIIVWIIKRFL